MIEISRSRTESVSKVQRSQILLAYYRGNSISIIARKQHLNRPKIERCINLPYHVAWRRGKGGVRGVKQQPSPVAKIMPGGRDEKL